MRAGGAALYCAVAFGCSSNGTDGAVDVDAGDASTSTPLEKAKGDSVPVTAKLPAALSRAFAIASRDKQLADVIAPNPAGLRALDAAFATEGWRLASDASLMGAKFPTHADESFRMGPGRVDRWAATLAPVGARHAVGEEHDGRLAYEDAWPSTDLVVVSGRRGVEWMLTLRDDRAPAAFAWKLSLGKDLKVDPGRLGNGAIDLVDGKGDAALRIHPAFAVDAKGTRREAKLEIVDGELRLSLDRTGLEYPILLDPATSVPIWQKVKGVADTGGLQYVRYGNTGAWNPSTNTVLSIGGAINTGLGATPGKETRSWDGSAWSTFASYPENTSYVAAASAGGRVYTFGGCSDVSCTTMSANAVLGGASWSPLCGPLAGTSCGPQARAQAGLAGIGPQLLLFGGAKWDAVGSRYVHFDDLWTLDTSAGATTFTNITGSVPGRPKPRRGFAFAGQPSGNYAMVFGGTDGALMGDTWLWKRTANAFQCACSCALASPSVAPCTGEPQPRAFAASAWDDARQRFIVAGGYTQYGDGIGRARSAFEFDPTTFKWTVLCGEGVLDGCGSMDPFEQPAAAYDAVRRRVVLAGGQTASGSISGDTWTLYVRGGSCTSNADCDTFYCVEGTCCEKSACATCETCANPATPGVCTTVTSAPDPLGRCVACDASGICKKGNGTSCAAGSECGSGFCVENTCCHQSSCGGGLTCANSSGTCLKTNGSSCAIKGDCSSTFCTDGVCCTTNACSPGSRCDWSGANGSCKKNPGQSCTTSTECGTGYCVDGYCCNAACTGQCEACDQVKGTCMPVSGAPHSNAVTTRTACSGTGECKAQCNGSDPTTCNYPGSLLPCGTASCASNTQTLPGTCNGSGSCTQPTSSCGNYACGTNVCKSSCTADTDCRSTAYYCSAGSCVAKLATGTACAAANQCSSGNCVDGVCCGTSTCASGSTCNGASKLGTCTLSNGQTCTTGTQCGSGICADGVCCGTACAGLCQACNVTGSVGTCANVVGAPAIGHGSCGGTGSGTTCGMRCDGTKPDTCVYPTATTCGTPSCTGTTETTLGSCNGAGVCSTGSKSCGAYTCGPTVCKTTCGSNSDCATDYYCKAGTCTAKETEGTSCTAIGAAGCKSGNCVNGVCCSSSSCGTGEVCNAPGRVGECAKPNGVACTTSAECGSGFCVDKVCCDSACGSQCQACDVSGKVGSCSPVAGAPHGTRAACSGSGVGTECGPTCNGVDASACKYPTGTATCGANTCVTGVETHLSVCNGSGACGDVPETCNGYVCEADAKACKNNCTVNTDCATGYYCKTGACVAIEGLGTSCSSATTCTTGFCTDGVCCAVGSCGAGKSCSAGLTKGLCASLNGTTCKADTECASGACVDGVCCDSKCGGSCEACNQTGSLGKCVPVVGNPLTGHAPCTGTSTDASCAMRCDGTDGKNCKYPTTTTSCGSPSCGGGVEKQVSSCDGGGNCKPAAKDCGSYACGPTACLTACTKNDECATGNYCKSGSCVAVEGLGNKCTDPTQCKSGFCTDGVCCALASCGEGSSCSASDGTKPGQCLKKKGATCTAASDCATGRCVDGVCCDSACDGKCEACDITGSEGTCTPVVGAPHGGRMACDSLAEKDCARTSCDGKTRDKCEGFANGTSISCGADSCTADKRVQKAGSCDGKGACATPEPTNCTPYACDTASPRCRSTCASDAECADGFTCDGSACVQGAKCSDDRSKSIAKTGEEKLCTPYRCGSDGKCATSCGSSDDCAAGTVCDTNVKACVVYSGATGDEGGGCTIGPRAPATGSVAGFALGLLGMAAFVRRRAIGR